MNLHYPYDEYDDPSWQQPIYRTLAPGSQSRLQQRPWSPDPYSSDDYDGDGGAIAHYLEEQKVQRERGWNAAGPSEQYRNADAQRLDTYGGNRRGKGREEQYARPPPEQERTAYEQSYDNHRHTRRQRQEASDLSVEALDLADYSNTFLHRAPPSNLSRESPPTAQVPADDYTRYPPHATPARTLPSNLDDVPPVDRPFSDQSRRSRGTIRSGGTSIGPPPSFVSARERLGSPSSQHSHVSSRNRPQAGRNTKTPTTKTRHMSLPPTLAHAPGDIVPSSFPGPTNYQADPDVRTFPKWSRGWYDSGTRQGGPPSYPRTPEPIAEEDLGTWPPQAASSANVTPNYPGSSLGLSSANLDGSLPWGHTISHPGHSQQTSDPPQYVPVSVREERLRMLEREFGGKGKGKEVIPGETMIGSVDAQGTLITDGPKARTAVRVMQNGLALAAAASGIYGAVAIHPTPPAPPASKPPAYVLYAFSVITFLFTVYYFGVRPCIRRSQRRKRDSLTGQPGVPGMMVLPVIQGMGKKGKGPSGGGKKGKKGKGQRGQDESVQVNLIVDPTMFGGGGNGSGRGTRSKRRRRDEDDNEDDASSLSDFNDPLPSLNRRKHPRRRNVFEAIAMEEDWKAARTSLKWQFTVDILFMVAWSAVFFYILWGQRCPPGGYDGWCNAYNVATACAALMAVAFIFGIFYDIKDLAASKVSPRTRT